MGDILDNGRTQERKNYLIFFPLCIKMCGGFFSLNKQQFIIEISFEMWYNIYYTYFYEIERILKYGRLR